MLFGAKPNSQVFKTKLCSQTFLLGVERPSVLSSSPVSKKVFMMKLLPLLERHFCTNQDTIETTC